MNESPPQFHVATVIWSLMLNLLVPLAPLTAMPSQPEHPREDLERAKGATLRREEDGNVELSLIISLHWSLDNTLNMDISNTVLL